MKEKTLRVLTRIAILTLLFCLIPLSPALALSASDYFSYTLDVKLSQTEVHQAEVFTATVEGRATCTKDLPITISRGQVISSIVAQHQASGARIILVPSYVVTIDAFPNTKGEVSQSTVVLSLAFPPGSASGVYNVTGELIQAQVEALSTWIDVSGYLPSSQSIGSVTYVGSDGAAGGGGIGGISPGLPIDEHGKFTQDVTVFSEDNEGQLTISEGTVGTVDGEPIKEISFKKMAEPPPKPEDASIVGLTYDLGPDGAVFSKKIKITLPHSVPLPEGVTEADLKIAVWDGEKWVILGGVVDPVNHTISVEIDSFTPYTVLALISPAEFTTSGLEISPLLVQVGEGVKVSALISNIGRQSGSYNVVLKVDGKVVETKEKALAGGASEKVSFSLVGDKAGIYTVDVNGQVGTYEVKKLPVPVAFSVSELKISPEVVEAGGEVKVSVLVANTGEVAGSYKVVLKVDNVVVETKGVTVAGGGSERVSFTTAGVKAGTYQVEVNGLRGKFEVKAVPTTTPPTTTPTTTPPTTPPPPEKPLNWWLVSSIIAEVIVIIALLIILRRKIKSRHGFS